MPAIPPVVAVDAADAVVAAGAAVGFAVVPISMPGTAPAPHADINVANNVAVNTVVLCSYFSFGFCLTGDDGV